MSQFTADQVIEVERRIRDAVELAVRGARLEAQKEKEKYEKKDFRKITDKYYKHVEKFTGNEDDWTKFATTFLVATKMADKVTWICLEQIVKEKEEMNRFFPAGSNMPRLMFGSCRYLIPGLDDQIQQLKKN